ncbi:MAG: hypothetical protein DHS20C15_28680 [Planctomycetota bacterium]|nr:MAG: hypothetical protein DHS20C15_28680 [Planctomycetota bacterium]
MSKSRKSNPFAASKSAEPDMRPIDEQIAALGKSVAKAQRRLEKTLAKQRREVVSVAEELVRASTVAVQAARNLKEWPSDEQPAVDNEVFEKLSTVVRASFSALQSEPERPDELDELAQRIAGSQAEHETPSQELAQEAVQAVSMAWQNALATHQQQSVLAEAVLQQGVAMLFSLASDALTEKQELNLDALTRAATQASKEFDGVYELDDPYKEHRDDEDDDDADDW